MSWIDSDGVEQEDFIEIGDVKDSVSIGFELEEYIGEVNEEIIDLAERKGVRDTADISTPVHYKIKRFGVVYLLMRLFQDKAGVNNVDLAEMEKYVIKYNMYKRELTDLEARISYAMITGNVGEIRDRVKTTTLYRG